MANSQALAYTGIGTPKTAATGQLRSANDIGHPIATPEGDVIRIPRDAFGLLKKLKLLTWNDDLKLRQVTPAAYAFLDASLDPITSSRPAPVRSGSEFSYRATLRSLLGVLGSGTERRMIGPRIVACACPQCRVR